MVRRFLQVMATDAWGWFMSVRVGEEWLNIVAEVVQDGSLRIGWTPFRSHSKNEQNHLPVRMHFDIESYKDMCDRLVVQAIHNPADKSV